MMTRLLVVLLAAFACSNRRDAPSPPPPRAAQGPSAPPAEVVSTEELDHAEDEQLPFLPDAAPDVVVDASPPKTPAQLVDEIRHGLLSEGDFVDDGWSAIALVAQVDGFIGIHGFKYYPNRTVVPAADINFDTTLMFAELADQMAKAKLGGRRWKTCLVHISKPTMKIRFQYDYDDVNRWKVTPSNLDEMKRALRPK